MQFLGNVIGKEGIMVDPAKIEVVASWERPKDPYGSKEFSGVSKILPRICSRFLKDSYPVNETDTQDGKV